MRDVDFRLLTYISFFVHRKCNFTKVDALDQQIVIKTIKFIDVMT